MSQTGTQNVNQTRNQNVNQRVNQNASRRAIFNVTTIVQQYKNLEDSALSRGEEDTRFWESLFQFAFHNVRKGNQGTQWVTISCSVGGVIAPLKVRVNNEVIIGQIMPSSEAGLAEYVANNPNVKHATVRTKKPALSIQEWKVQVKTSEDGISILTDADGNPIYPDDDKRSLYYKLTKALNRAFVYEVNDRIEKGKLLLSLAASMKKADKTVSAETVIDNFITTNGQRKPGDMILSTETVNNLRKFFPNQKDTDKLTKGAIITSNTKVIELNQEYISPQAMKNAGLKLPNPITRVSLNFDLVTGVAQTAFFDKNAPYIADGKQKYEVGRVDGEPINAELVHKFFPPRTGVDGIIDLGAVCLSNMGISLPVKAEVIVASRPAARGVSLDDVYDDNDVFENGNIPVANLNNAIANLNIANNAVTANIAVEENYDDLLGELGGN